MPHPDLERGAIHERKPEVEFMPENIIPHPAPTEDSVRVVPGAAYTCPNAHNTSLQSKECYQVRIEDNALQSVSSSTLVSIPPGTAQPPRHGSLSRFTTIDSRVE